MTDVVRVDAPIVVGSGVAGLTVALGLSRSVVVSATDVGATWWAQGGIAAAIAPGDSPAAHAVDTIEVAGGLATKRAVEILTTGGPGAIARLIELGTTFDRDESGDLLLGREAGHGARRVVHADGDATGAEVMRSLSEAAQEAESIEVLSGHRVLDLVTSDYRVVGVVVDRPDGKRQAILGTAVVLATGGAGRLFARTTNPPGVTGEGIAMAGRVGARLADLEFVQFHPTALLAGKDPLPLLTEALRGEGALLVDAYGRRFMTQHHPDAEMAPRDIVARAIWWQLDRGHGAYLDARKVINLPDRFPTVFAHSQSVGLDPREDLLPVSPAAHYFIGGIDASPTGQTSLEGLWAVGECASTGVHGANRLASNSLLEGLVFGARVAADVESLQTEPGDKPAAPKEAFDIPVVAGPLLEDLRSIMWDRVGLVRLGSGLWEARSNLLEASSVLRRTAAGRGAVDLALLVILAALRRSESRGGHYRADYPEPDPLQTHRALVQPNPVTTVPL